jgi:hypothetical protein
MSAYKSVAEILEDARRKGIVTDSEIRRFSADSWGRPFRWELHKRRGKAVGRILSAGPNGIFENGEGDDICWEFQIPEERKRTPE